MTGVRWALEQRLKDEGDGARAGELVWTGRYPQAPARSQDATGLGERFRLVRHPVEDGRHADGVEARVLEGAQILGLSHLEPHGATVRARDADAVLERIDTDDAPLRSQLLANPPRQAPRPTPDIEDARAFLERKPLDQALASFELEVAHPIVGL